MKKPLIIFEDKNILIAEKPQGMPSQKDPSGDEDLLSWAEKNQKEKVRNRNLKILNRLDRPVGGLVLFAKTAESVKILSRDIQNRNIKKDYLAVAEGIPEKEIMILKDWLSKDSEKNFSEAVSEDEENAKYAELSLKMLEKTEDKSLLNIRLKTGRHHQIRVQLSEHGLPIWGDKKYNPEFSDSSEKTVISLWAYKLSFRHPAKKKIMTFCSFPPEIYPWTEFSDKYRKPGS